MDISNVDELYTHLRKKGVNFMHDEINKGWYFFHRIKNRNGVDGPCDGAVYPNRSCAIYAAADFFGVVVENTSTVGIENSRFHP